MQNKDLARQLLLVSPQLPKVLFQVLFNSELRPLIGKMPLVRPFLLGVASGLYYMFLCMVSC